MQWMIKVTQFKIEDVGWSHFNFKILFGTSSLSGEKRRRNSLALVKNDYYYYYFSKAEKEQKIQGLVKSKLKGNNQSMVYSLY